MIRLSALLKCGAAGAALAAACAAAPAAAQTSASPYTSATRYDAMRRVTGTISADPDTVGTGNPFLAVRNTYDDAGRLITVESGTLSGWQDETVKPENWAGFTAYLVVRTRYDAMDRKTRETVVSESAVRRVTQYNYDSFGRPDCTAVRMNSAAFPNTADAGGTLLSDASACTLGTAGSLGPDRVTRNVYDLAGQRVQLRDGVGAGATIEAAEATWDYNANGQITKVIDANGNLATLGYDDFTRQNRWTFPSTTRPSSYNDATQASALLTAGNVNAADYEAYDYDPQGNRTSLRKRDCSVLNYTYDALNRMTVKVVPARPPGLNVPQCTTDAQALTSAQTRDVYYAYDLRGLQTDARFDSLSGEGISNAWDGFGRLRSTTNSMGGTARTLAYQYDRDGDRTRITHPDGAAFNYLYDGLDRPTWIQDSNAAINYNYRAWGTSAGYGRFGGASGRYLSPDGRLTILNQYNGPSGALDVTWTFTHNPAGQAATQVLSNDLFAYTEHTNANTVYAANGLNQHSTIAGAAVTYDKNGNLIGDPGAVTGAASAVSLVYDVENRLVSASGGRSASLVYDPLGRLFSLTAGGNTTRFLYDGDALVAEYDGAGTLQHRYVHGVGADVPVMQYDGATVSLATRRYLLADARGSIVAVTDGSSLVQNRNAYDEYGVPAAANVGRFQYTGQIWLNELGLYHYKARIYSPREGRFLQTDPIGYQDQYNLYAYVENDPINLSDPSGREECCADNMDPRRDPVTGPVMAMAQQPRSGPPPSAAAVANDMLGWFGGATAAAGQAPARVRIDNRGVIRTGGRSGRPFYGNQYRSTVRLSSIAGTAGRVAGVLAPPLDAMAQIQAGKPADQAVVNAGSRGGFGAAVAYLAASNAPETLGGSIIVGVIVIAVDQLLGGRVGAFVEDMYVTARDKPPPTERPLNP